MKHIKLLFTVAMLLSFTSLAFSGKTKTSIEKNTQKNTQDEKKDCFICTDTCTKDYTSVDQICFTCKRKYLYLHDNCLFKWMQSLEESNRDIITCPFCNTTSKYTTTQLLKTFILDFFKKNKITGHTDFEAIKNKTLTQENIGLIIDKIDTFIQKKCTTIKALDLFFQANGIDRLLEEYCNSNIKNCMIKITIEKNIKQKLRDQKKRIAQHHKQMMRKRLATTTIILTPSTVVIFLVIFQPILHSIAHLSGNYRMSHSEHIMNISITTAALLSTYISKKLCNRVGKSFFPGK